MAFGSLQAGDRIRPGRLDFEVTNEPPGGY